MIQAGAYASNSVAVTPSDSTKQPFIFLYVGGAGDVTIVDAGGNTTLWKAVPLGSYIWCAGSQVKATGTTATQILALS